MTTSHKSRTPVGAPEKEQQQFALLENMSAKYTPLPNIQPVAGASGGAIRNPG